MTPKDKPFYELGLNPITMERPERVIKPVVKKNRVLNAHELADYVNIREIREMFNVSSYTIKSTLFEIAEPTYFMNDIFYHKKHLVEFKVQEKRKQISDDYISNTELLQMFQFSAFKAWDIAKKEKLLKVKLKGTKIYYNRIKAIETFKKYKV